ncbi:MAG: Hpt domain-containing protein [Lachnospiraceae bacterium]|nr:Hpt domain-containing protein [Lachnospiraceae bacterium]
MDITWLSEIGLDTKTGMDYTGGSDKYLSAIKRYRGSYEKNRIKIAEYLTSKDYESYMITVHALKSNSRMIGAMRLGEAFEELEMSARNNDIEVIDAKTQPTLEMYDELIKKLSPIDELGDVRAADEISADVAKDTADKLLVALDDFDDELSKELAKKLSGYPFRITQKEKLKEAIAYIEDFMYDEAIDVIREIYSAIE